jgi:hypothetical protein
MRKLNFNPLRGTMCLPDDCCNDIDWSPCDPSEGGAKLEEQSKPSRRIHHILPSNRPTRPLSKRTA